MQSMITDQNVRRPTSNKLVAELVIYSHCSFTLTLEKKIVALFNREQRVERELVYLQYLQAVDLPTFLSVGN